MTTVIQRISLIVTARTNCITSGNQTWLVRHTQTLKDLERDYLPSGAGIDNGTKIDLERSTGDKIVLTAAYHHMNHGYYEGWTEHTITVKPTFVGISVSVKGPNRNDINAYIGDTFQQALEHEIQ